MSTPRIDPELLAAFLDGMATPAEREEVLSLIAGSREAYAEFSEATAIRGALHGGVTSAAFPVSTSDQSPRETSAAPASPVVAQTPAHAPPAARNRLRFVVPIVLLAAAVLAIVVIPRSKRATAAVDVVAIAQATRVTGATGAGSVVKTIGQQWDAPGWTVTRGAGTETQAITARGFRTGLRLAQLQVAINAGDSLAAAGAKAQAQSLLGDIDGSGPLSQALDHIGAASAPGELTALASGVRALLGERAWFDLGVWIGAAQVAAAGDQRAFFVPDGAAVGSLRGILAAHPASDASWQRVSTMLRPVIDGSWQSAGAVSTIAPLLANVAAAAGN